MIKSIESMKGAFDLTGKTALVTGGAKGLGAAVALAIAESGADVAVADINDCSETIALLEQYKGKYRQYKVDTSALENVEKMADEFYADYDKLDILVNNAGISAVSDFLDDKDLYNWRNIMGINLFGTVNVTYTMGNRMRSAGNGGSIINMSSICGDFVVRTQNMVGYSVSKAGINAFTRCAAYELGQYDIRVNAIAPAFTNTDFSKMIPPDQIQYINDTFVLGRFNEPIEVGALAVFLASPAAAQITGAVIPINGGFDLSV